ncbi:MAG TPA: hypothetical protein VEX15_05550 [Nocardioidaceae bacterium]|nr:hypothetical protein [Nocardioidaceae bacterium]
MHDIDPAERRPSAAYPLSWQEAREAAWTADLAGPPAVQVVRAIVVTCVAFVMAGVIAGWLWVQWADPPTFQVLKTTAVMGEEEAGRQFGVDVTFALVGLGLAVPLGFLAGWRWHRVGWPLVVGAAASAGLAAVIGWRLGIMWGPGDPAGEWRSAQVGDQVPEQLAMHAKGLLLVWPIGALAGLILAVLVFSRPLRPRPYGGRIG